MEKEEKGKKRDTRSDEALPLVTSYRATSATFRAGVAARAKSPLR